MRVIRVGTLPDQMLFDKDRLVVQAGKPVEFVFENTDIDAAQLRDRRSRARWRRSATLAEAHGDPAGRRWSGTTSRSRTKILLASRLLQPREAQQLSFTAPKEPGIYPYVCTYPGHWRRMYGALYVVADLDEYLADPEGTSRRTRCRSRTSC